MTIINARINFAALCISFLASVSTAYAQTAANSSFWYNDPTAICSHDGKYFCEKLDLIIPKLQNIQSTQANELSTATLCNGFYDDLLSDGKIQIVIAMGYLDAEDDGRYSSSYVGDLAQFYGLRAKLLQECQPGLGACGFKPDSKNFTKLKKTVDLPELGKRFDVEIVMSNSAISRRHVENVTTNAVAQKKKSEFTRNLLLNSIRAGKEVVLYIGHSRKGGGMDFFPGRRKGQSQASGRFDYSSYMKMLENGERIGVNLIPVLDALSEAASANRAPKIFGSFSCDSQKHFYDSLKKASPNTGLVLSDNVIATYDNVRSLMATVDSLSQLRCKSGFARSLKLAKMESDQIGEMKLFEVFKNRK
jgi:hypothetical protein